MYRIKQIYPYLLAFSCLLAWLPAAAAAPLSPPPRLSESLGAPLARPASFRLIAEPDADAAAVNALADFLRENSLAAADEAAATIRLRQRRDKNAAAMRPELQRRLPLQPEGYLLLIEQQPGRTLGITVEGNDGRGLFYGVQTLKQLLSAKRLAPLRIEDYPELAWRGVVEGFYGEPWTHAQRLEQLQFYSSQRLNTYIYAPKDDPYHRAKWRDPYPAAEMARLQELIDAAAAQQVDFVFAISPGLDLRFAGAAGADDFAALRSKLDSLYAMGVRRFAIYFDDIADKSGRAQARILNRLQEEFVSRRAGVLPLLTVPTEYFSRDMRDAGGALKPYTRDFAAALNARVKVMYTGPEVVCEGIPADDLAATAAIYKRKMSVWWNYPVSDYLPQKLALGPLDGLPENPGSYADALAVNPMQHARLSKITVQTAAEYAWNPRRYQPEAAWRRALSNQYGPLADAMHSFADHSSHMENSWARAGRADAPEMRQAIDALWRKRAAGERAAAEIAALHAQFAQLARDCARLKDGLPAAVLAECLPQLDLLSRLAAYGQTALHMLETGLDGDRDRFARLQRLTEENAAAIERDPARISEKTAAAFPAEALRHAAQFLPAAP